MDALRRAEAAGSEASPEDTQAVLKDAIERPASNSPLQLEPLTPDATPGTDSPVATNTPGEDTAPEVPASPEASPQQAQAALEALAIHKSSAGKHLVFGFTGLLTAGAILAAYYFWQNHTATFYQVAPAATLIETPLPAGDTDVPIASAPVVAADTSSTTTPFEPAAPVESQAATSDTAQAAPAVAADLPEAAPRQDFRIEIHRTQQSSRVPAVLQQAYRAYRQGDYTLAEQQYRQALKSYPANRDAMLGLAAIALHQGNRQVARYYYERLVKADPADKTALLALQGLSGEQYSLETGSKLKYWLQSEQNNPQLHFALGNQYAASAQWKEAQQSYFEALRLAPSNADYAFNLAVSLDRLGLARQALGYYRQAQQLAARGGALFSTSQLEKRIRQLQDVREPG